MKLDKMSALSCFHFDWPSTKTLYQCPVSKWANRAIWNRHICVVFEYEYLKILFL